MSVSAFEYVAVDRRGERVRGVARGATSVDVVRQVGAAGLTPIRVRRVREARRRGRVRGRDVAQLTHQLGVLLQARVPIGEGLRSIAEQEPAGRFRDMVLSIAARVESGDRIAQALAEHEAVLGTVYVQTVAAAEQSGTLIKTLEYLTEATERAEEMRQQLRGALMYPACVVSVLGLATTFLVGGVVPRFAKMFEARGMELPLVTRVLAAVGESVAGFWFLYAAAAAGAFFGARAAWRRPGGRRVVEGALDRVPVVSTLLSAVATARLARVLGMGLSAGVPLLDSLRLAGRAAGRVGLAADIERLIDQVRAGRRLSGALVATQHLPPFAKRMLASGEEAAELPRMCGVVARHYEREASGLAKNAATVIEPVLVVLIAMVVLVVALAIFLPMWNMARLMQG